MYTELTNLLPRSKIKSFKREYLFRLATVGILLLVLLVIILGVLLIPSYLYAREEITTESGALDRLSKTLDTAEAQQAQGELSTLQTESTQLTKLSSVPKASATIDAVLNVPRTGISINGFTFTPPQNGNAGTLQISGVAGTREELSAYDQSLGALPFVTNANLPISEYAQDSNIPFTITLTGQLSP
jgi:Tfp pilus assembly protein PilN